MGINHIYIFQQCLVVATDESGKILGSNAIEFIEDVATIGPISVDPDAQTGGVGRKLMEAVVGVCD